MLDPATFNTLRRFRAGVYHRFGARRDALFELLDAATVAGLVPSLAYLSLVPVHRRRWGSLYDALAVGRMDTAALRELVARYPLDDGQPICAVDTSVWPRDDAATSPERGHYFSSSRQSAGQPIVTGWSYSWLAQLSLIHDSWTAPLDVQRVPAGGNAHAVAAAQIGELVEHLPVAAPVPLCVFDAGYDPPSLARELAELDGEQVAVLVRLRSDRCFYADPPPPTGPKVGRPRQHGQKFACGDERTWWAPTEQHTEQHAQYGRVRVRAWAGFRHRPRGYALLARLGEQLRAAPDLQAAGAAAVTGLCEGIGVGWAGIWVYADAAARPTLRPVAVTASDTPGTALVLTAAAAGALRDSAGQVSEPPAALRALWPRPAALMVTLAAGQELAGVLACGQRPGDSLNQTDAQLLAVLGRDCALALHTRQLEAQLQARLGQIESQAAELRRSRQRLMAAQDEQRRHIERDLHDGVQQQLVGLAAALRRCAAASGTGLSGPLTQLAADAEEVVFALQELARGIFPAILADQGLAAALRTQAARSPLAIRVEVAPSLARLRLGTDVESALYFVALEAMANAAKHAPHAAVSIELRPVPGQPEILLEVHDNGPGFDPRQASGGTGMQNIADRIAAVGGELTVDTRPGAGTWVRARAPLPAPPNVIPLPAS